MTGCYYYIIQLERGQVMNIQKSIKELRHENNLTQHELAEKAGIPRATIAMIETGDNTNPTLSTLVAIAKALNIDIDGLVYRD